MNVEPALARAASLLVVEHHYLHRRPPISHAFVLTDPEPVGVVTFGVPASRHLQMSACREEPDSVIELNRLWLSDDLPRNTASWFVSRALRALPPRIIVSYADTAYGHDGTVYRAMSWHWAGWTDMERKTPRLDYMPASGGHTRDAFRGGYLRTQRRRPKFRYWTTTGTPSERRALAARCTWPAMVWADTPNKPMPQERAHHDGQ